MTASQGFRAVKSIGDIINVKASYFGAKGNSSTDDRGAIQTALNYAHTYGAKRVYIPGLTPGNYYNIGAYLWLWPDLEIFGDGVSSWIKNTNDGVASATRQGIFALGYYGTGGTDDIGSEISFESIAISATTAGQSTLTLTNPSTDFSKFSVGDMLLVYNDTTETWSGKGSRTTLECARVVALSSPTVYLDRTLHNSSSTAFCSISGRAGLTSGINEPSGHVLKVMPGLHFHDLKLAYSGFNSLPGYVYRMKAHDLHIDGPYGVSADFVCESHIHHNHFAYGEKGVELALRSHGTVIHDNIGYLDSARTPGGAANYVGVWYTEGARKCRDHDNKFYSNREWTPLKQNQSAEDCESADNWFYSTASTIASALSDIALANVTRPIVRGNTFIGGNKFYTNLDTAANIRIDGNRHLNPNVSVEQAVTVQNSGSGLSGYIRNNIFDGNLTYDFNGCAVSNVSIEVYGNAFLGTVTNTSQHPKFYNNKYVTLGGDLRASSTLYTLNTGTETTIFSHTIGGDSKYYTRWETRQFITDTAIPSADRTAKLLVDGSTQCTITLPSTFGRAYTELISQWESKKDSALRLTLTANMSPFTGGGAVYTVRQHTVLTATGTTAQVFATNFVGSSNAACNISLTQFRKEGIFGGSWST